MNRALWIVVPRWEEFQHYRDRDPVWIKNYTRLLNDPDYLDLPEGARAILHGLWLLYASGHARIPLDTRSISRRLNLRVTSAQLERLNDAGWIEFSASRPLAPSYRDARPEGERELDPPLPQKRKRRAKGTNPRSEGTNPRAVAERNRPRRNAERWIENGLADEIPPERLRDVLAEEFDVDADDLADLVAYAQERANGSSTEDAVAAFFDGDVPEVELREMP